MYSGYSMQSLAVSPGLLKAEQGKGQTGGRGRKGKGKGKGEKGKGPGRNGRGPSQGSNLNPRVPFLSL